MDKTYSLVKDRLWITQCGQSGFTYDGNCHVNIECQFTAMLFLQEKTYSLVLHTWKKYWLSV